MTRSAVPGSRKPDPVDDRVFRIGTKLTHWPYLILCISPIYLPIISIVFPEAGLGSGVASFVATWHAELVLSVFLLSALYLVGFALHLAGLEIIDRREMAKSQNAGPDNAED
jgi:hypothetical protein